MEYAISTFCYGERYYQQTNRLIESFDDINEKPDFFIVTDNPSALIERPFVKKKNITEYNKKYSQYENDYYSFDFSVKRFSLLYAFENGYNNVILTDTDAIPNYDLFNTELREEYEELCDILDDYDTLLKGKRRRQTEEIQII